MKLKPLMDILKNGGEKVKDAILAPHRVNQNKKRAELKIAELDEKIATTETEINEMCTEHPIDFERLIEKQDKFGLLERRRKQFETIVDQLFPA